MKFDIDEYYNSIYKKVDAVPFGYLEYRLSYAPNGYVYCSDRAGNAVYVKTRQDGSLVYEDSKLNVVG